MQHRFQVSYFIPKCMISQKWLTFEQLFWTENGGYIWNTKNTDSKTLGQNIELDLNDYSYQRLSPNCTKVHKLVIELPMMYQTVPWGSSKFWHSLNFFCMVAVIPVTVKVLHIPNMVGKIKWMFRMHSDFFFSFTL